MKRLITLVLSLLFLVALLSFTVTYTVRFTESAVLTTFGRADDGSITTEPGLKFKWPYPIQSVTKYDTRVRFHEALLETQQTADDRQIVVRAFCLWRVSDPAAFFRNFSDAGDRAEEQYRKAESIIGANLRSALAETSAYRLDELFTSDASESKLPELENRILQALTRAETDIGALSEAGLEVVELGINSIRLPEATTRNVFDRMSADRDRLAQTLRSEGQARASAIRDTATQNANAIRDFAEARADEIRALGDIESVPFLQQMAEEEGLAVLQRELEFLRNNASKKSTLVLPFSTSGLELFDPATIQSWDATSQVLPGRAGQRSAPAQSSDAGAAESEPTAAGPTQTPSESTVQNSVQNSTQTAADTDRDGE